MSEAIRLNRIIRTVANSSKIPVDVLKGPSRARYVSTWRGFLIREIRREMPWVSAEEIGRNLNLTRSSVDYHLGNTAKAVRLVHLR